MGVARFPAALQRQRHLHRPRHAQRLVRRHLAHQVALTTTSPRPSMKTQGKEWVNIVERPLVNLGLRGPDEGAVVVPLAEDDLEVMG